MRRFLALGDSYTIGEGVAESDRWPTHLVAMLRDTGVAVADPEIVAQTAWTTDELWDAIDQRNLRRGQFDLVTLMIGVNDQYRGRDIPPFARHYELLLRRARSLAGGRASRVINVSIPDWGATPFAAGRNSDLIAREIAAFNAAAEKIASALGARWVDVTASSSDMRHDRRLVVADGLHPSGEMYRRWAELILPEARQILL